MPILLIRHFHFKDLDAGILEGTVEGFSLIIRALTGLFSDFIGKRKAFLVWGYGISTFSRFLLAPATSVYTVISSRFIEKLGNGLQASPREAFISDITPQNLLGRAYGLNKTLSMSGSFAGSFLIFFIFLFQRDFSARLILWGAGVIAVISFLILLFGVKEVSLPHHKPSVAEGKSVFIHQLKTISKDLGQFSSTFWIMLGVVFLFKLGYFSGTFMMSLLRNSHASFFGIPLHDQQGLSNSVFLIIQNLACSIFAYPLGFISDKINRYSVVGLGFIFLILSLMCFGWSGSSSVLYAGILFYGMQMSIQGALMALLSTTMPAHLHGTGFGLFFIVSGTSITLTNQVFMRDLVQLYGESFAFFSICAFVLMALMLLFFLRWHTEKKTRRLGTHKAS
jgi:MFS family permease